MKFSRKEIDALLSEQSPECMRLLVQASNREPLTAGEIFDLATALAKSGHILVWHDEARTADLASTGGPSSLSTLLSPLYLRSAGLVVPKLGVPGRPAGGIDVLAQLSGYRTTLSDPQLRGIIRKCGFAHFLAGGMFAPLDSTFFMFRQECGGQDIPALVSASLLAKKIACGLHAVGIDIRVAPHGNFGHSFGEARRACRSLLQAAEMANINMVCVLSDATIPYQPFIGRGESLAALKQVFSSYSGGELAEHNNFCALMAHQVARLEGYEVHNVNAREVECIFLDHIEAQGSSQEAFNKKVDDVLSGHIYEIEASTTGYSHVDLLGLRKLFHHLHTRRRSVSVPFPDELGLILRVRSGDHVVRGAVLATVRAPQAVWEKCQWSLREFVRTVPDQPPQRKIPEVIHV